MTAPKRRPSIFLAWWFGGATQGVADGFSSELDRVGCKVITDPFAPGGLGCRNIWRDIEAAEGLVALYGDCRGGFGSSLLAQPSYATGMMIPGLGTDTFIAEPRPLFVAYLEAWRIPAHVAWMMPHKQISADPAEPALQVRAELARPHTTYTARCENSGDGLAISVPELPGVHTQVRWLSEIDATIRDAIALFLDVRPDSFEIRVKFVRLLTAEKMEGA